MAGNQQFGVEWNFLRAIQHGFFYRADASILGR
jgi:hypothetical protein